MSEQRPLFDGVEPQPLPDSLTGRHLLEGELPLPYQRHSPTSAAAAAAAEPQHGTQLADVWQAMRHAGAAGFTDEECQQHLGMNPNTQRPRRVELVRRGLVLDSGRTRPTVAGRAAVVWVAS